MGIFNWAIDKPTHEAIGEAIGAASMCWEPKPAGVFDSDRAGDIMDELEDFLEKKRLDRER